MPPPKVGVSAVGKEVHDVLVQVCGVGPEMSPFTMLTELEEAQDGWDGKAQTA